MEKNIGPVNSIVLSRSAESDNVFLQDGESVAQNGLCEIKIKDNQIMNNNDRSDYLPDILQKLDGLEYYINDFSSTGILYYDLCDKYTASIRNQNYSCIMLNDEINVKSGIEELIYTEMPEQSETDYTKADKTDRRINQTTFIVDKQNQQIQGLITQIGDRSQKTTSVTADIDNINATIQNSIDITNDVTGNQLLTLENCMEGYLLELHIYGNNTVFEPLYPSPTLYPNPTLYPRGGNLILKVTSYDEDENAIITKYNFGKIDVLRQLGTVYDEFVLEKNIAKVIRRIGVTSNDTLYELSEPVEEEIGAFSVLVGKGTNIVELMGYQASMYAKFVVLNDYTEVFATNVELESSVQLLDGTIELKTSKKVDNDKILSSINLSPETIKILAERIQLEGYVTVNQTFRIRLDGSIECVGGNIGGFNIDVNALYSNQVGVVSNPSDFSGIAFWAGADTTQIGSAPFKALSNGTVYALGGIICQDLNSYSNLSLSGYATNGTVTASDFINSSQAELKENIKAYKENASKIINNTDIYTYNYIGKDEEKIGVVIGDKYNTPKEIIVTRENPVTKNINKGIDIYTMASISWQAHKEKDKRIKELEERIKILEERIK